MRVLLTGASGFVGRHVADVLRQEGHRLRCLVRPTSDAAHLRDAGDELHQGHMGDEGALRSAADGVEAVVHVAGLVRARGASELLRVNGEGAARLARACLDAAAPGFRFVLVSSQAAAGPSSGGRPSRETDPPRPVSWYGQSKLAGETAVHRLLGSVAPPTILRPPAVYGPHDRDVFEFFQAAARGVLLRVGCRARPVSVVHVHDLARGVLAALTSSRSPGRTYFLANPSALPLNDLLARIAEAVGRPTICLPVPEAVLRGAAVVADEVARFLGVAPKLSRDKARELLAPGWACDVSRAREELGWESTLSVGDGLRSTVAWYRENSWL